MTTATYDARHLSSTIPALAARIEAALASSQSMSDRDDISAQTRQDRLWIGQRFHQLKRPDNFTEAEIQAKREWLEGVMGEAITTGWTR